MNFIEDSSLSVELTNIIQFIKNFNVDSFKQKLGDKSKTKFDRILIKNLNKLINILLTQNLKLGVIDIFEKIEDNTLIAGCYDTDGENLVFSEKAFTVNGDEYKLNSEEPEKNDDYDIVDIQKYFNTQIDKIREFRKVKIESDYYNKPKIFLKTEMIKEDNKRPDLNASYEILEGSIDEYNNVVGILEYNRDNQNKNNNLIQNANIFHKRNVIFTLYQKKSNKEYIIVNNKNTAKVTSMLIPGLKYNYQSSDQSKMSLLSFSKKY